MRALSKIGNPIILVVALIFGIGGATALNAGQVLEGILFIVLSVLVSALTWLIMSDQKPESPISRDSRQRHEERMRRILSARIDRQVTR